MIPSVNATCGTMFPLIGNFCNNSLALPDAKYCYGLFNGVRNFGNNLHLPRLPVIPDYSVFDTLCEVPNLLGYCYNYSSIEFYHWACYDYASYIKNIYSNNCNSSAALTAFSNSTAWMSSFLHGSNYSSIQNKTCGDLFHYDFCEDINDQYVPMSSCIGWEGNSCDKISTFSETVARLNASIFHTNQTIIEAFTQSLPETLARYNQTLLDYQHIFNESLKKHIHLAGEYAQKVAELDHTIPGYNHSCTEKFISYDALDECNWSANFACREFNRYPGDPNEWWSTNRTLIIIGVTVGLVLILGTTFFAIFKGTSWLNQKNKVDDLSDEDKEELEEIFEFCEFDKVNPVAEMQIDEAKEIVGKNIATIPDHKKLLNNIRFSFLMGREDRKSPIPYNLPNEIAYKIFHHAELFTRPTVDDHYISNLRFSFILGREDAGSTIPGNLPDNVAHKIFYYAGLFARPPACFSSASTDSDSSYNFKALVFLSGRSAEDSYIPEILPPNVFRMIFSYAGFFSPKQIIDYRARIQNSMNAGHRPRL